MDPAHEEPTLNEIQREEGGAAKRSPWLIIGGIVLVVGLVLIGLFLPPISLGERLGLGGSAEATPAVSETAVDSTANAGATSIPGEITLTLADGASTVTVTATSLDEFIQANSNAVMPAGTAVQGNVYTVNYEGNAPAGQVELTIPETASPETLDLYGWNGSAWDFVPSEIDPSQQQIESDVDAVSQAYALVTLPASQSPEIGAEVAGEQTVAPELLPLLTKVNVGGMTLADDGALVGETQPMPAGPYDQYLLASNTGPIINQQALSTMLNNADLQAAQIGALASAAVSGGYAGVNLDYQAVSQQDREAFTQFVSSLAQTLDQQGLALALTLPSPVQVGAKWDAAGYDWAALGAAAQDVFMQMPLNPEAYLENGSVDQLLLWASHQIPRDKLIMLLTANATSNVGEFYQELSNAEALTNFGKLEFVQGGEEVEPGTAVEVALSGTASPLEWDGDSLTYKYSYEDENGQVHNVWLANASALANRLNLAKKYNLGGVAVRGLGDAADGAGYAAALNSFLTNSAAPSPASAAIVWTVRDTNTDSVIASATGEELTYAWDGSADAGNFLVQADFALGEAVLPLGSLAVAVGAEEEVVEEAPVEESVAEVAEAADANATVNVAANIRYGPAVTYGILANGLQAGTRIAVIGRDEGSTWLNILTPNGEKAWIYATLVSVDSGVDVAALPIGEAIDVPAAAAGSGASTTTNSSTGSTAPPPVTVPPVSNASFELGGQVFGAPYGVMSQAGMTWVKKQHKWGPGNSPTDVAGMISQAHGGGMKILLSIPGPRYPDTLPDFNAYVEFLRGVAALPDPPDAIEVWNEQNINAEWVPGNIDPAMYVNSMLAPAYNAIKSSNPNVMVISGAPAPTGYFGGCSTNGCDDSTYIAGMAAAGAGNYMDCVGVHYNEGIISPTQNSGDPRTEHYTRYFSGMMNTYWNTFGKPLCFTELGYLTGDGIGALPEWFSWAGNTTVGQQAQWLAEAASLSASSGKVRMLIVWNVDSTTWGDDPQSGYAIIRPDGSCPACGTLGQVMGR